MYNQHLPYDVLYGSYADAVLRELTALSAEERKEAREDKESLQLAITSHPNHGAPTIAAIEKQNR